MGQNNTALSVYKRQEHQKIVDTNIALATQLVEEELDQSKMYTLHQDQKGYEENRVWILETYPNEKYLKIYYRKEDQPKPTGLTDPKEKETRRTGYLNFCKLANFLIPESEESPKLIRNESLIAQFAKVESDSQK